LDSLTNEPQRISLDGIAGAKGELWAMMLDQERTLDDLVSKYAPDKGALARSKQNNIYRLLSSALAGMQEYMALDKLHDLYTGGYFDLVVLDTPPTKNALDFLNTPGRARQFFDDRVMKWFIPSKAASRGLFAKVFDPGSVVLSLLGRIFGEAFVKDLVDFFDTLSFLQDALRTRGEMIDFILRDEATHFVVITSAEARRIKEAMFFHEKLSELNQKAAAFVLNRVIPNFDESDLDGLDPLKVKKAFQAAGVEDRALLEAAMRARYLELAKLSAHNRSIISKFAKQVGAEKLCTVPLFGEDVHDLKTLQLLGSYVVG
jgi:anion-transporting  ArsA/GET3 family ATPase